MFFMAYANFAADEKVIIMIIHFKKLIIPEMPGIFPDE